MRKERDEEAMSRDGCLNSLKYATVLCFILCIDSIWYLSK